MKTLLGISFVLHALCAAGDLVPGKPGQTVQIGCGVKTKNKDVEWKHQDKMMFTVNGRRGTERKGVVDIIQRSKVMGDALKITEVQEADFGLFTCIVEHTAHQHRLYMVSASVSPSSDLRPGSQATLQCQVRGLDPPPAVEWERPGGEKAEVAGEAGTVRLDPMTRSDAGSWVCKFSYDGVTYRETLNVGVADSPPNTPPPPVSAVLSANPGQTPADCRNCVTADQTPTKVLGLGLWAWVGVAVGVGGLVVALLAAFLIALHQRNRRMRRKIRKLRTTGMPLRGNNYCECPCPTAAAPRGRGEEGKRGRGEEGKRGRGEEGKRGREEEGKGSTGPATAQDPTQRRERKNKKK